MVSVCITVFNEEATVTNLIESLLPQLSKSDELIIVDGGSSDATLKLIQEYAKKDIRIKAYYKKLSRSAGRNYAVKKAKYDIIAMTDAGCRVHKNWLKLITKPLVDGEGDAVAGFYKMKANNDFQKAETVYLGVLPMQFNSNFLPSTRSIAFTKKAWEKVGGFPESLEDTAEDTLFNAKLVEKGVKIKRVKNAVVEWGMPGDIREFSKKISSYAKGDVLSGIWNHPLKPVIYPLSFLYLTVPVV